jgi:hypothetical protein
MERDYRMSRAGFIVVSVVVFAMSAALSSCSRTSVEIRPHTAIAKPSDVSVEKPGVPYCRINYDYPISAICNPKLYVIKSERRLLVVENDILVRDYHIALGHHPRGDKYMRGDGRTPEGDFFVCVKKPASQYYKSLGLSYPSPKHAEEAREAGAISQDEFSRILNAYESGRTPPWNTSLGGAIFIHGGGASEDWTLGCVAVNNNAMDELFDTVPVGTPVKILP